MFVFVTQLNRWIRRNKQRDKNEIFTTGDKQIRSIIEPEKK